MKLIVLAPWILTRSRFLLVLRLSSRFVSETQQTVRSCLVYLVAPRWQNDRVVKERFAVTYRLFYHGELKRCPPLAVWIKASSSTTVILLPHLERESRGPAGNLGGQAGRAALIQSVRPRQPHAFFNPRVGHEKIRSTAGLNISAPCVGGGFHGIGGRAVAVAATVAAAGHGRDLTLGPHAVMDEFSLPYMRLVLGLRELCFQGAFEPPILLD